MQKFFILLGFNQNVSRMPQSFLTSMPLGQETSPFTTLSLSPPCFSPDLGFLVFPHHHYNLHPWLISCAPWYRALVRWSILQCTNPLCSPVHPTLVFTLPWNSEGPGFPLPVTLASLSEQSPAWELISGHLPSQNSQLSRQSFNMDSSWIVREARSAGLRVQFSLVDGGLCDFLTASLMQVNNPLWASVYLYMKWR